MPDASHVEKLRAGARAWNAWRSQHPDIAPDLNDLDLPVGCRQFGHMQGGPVDLSQAELCRAALEHATLIEADLAAAMLIEADLSHARLRQADLRGADLTNATLDHADLGDAQLVGASLHGARLHHARNLTQAQINAAHGDRATTLPAQLAFPEHWLKDEEGRNSQLEKRVGAAAGSIDDPWSRLGVSRKASLREIRAAYVRLVKELHPDAHAHNPAAVDRLKEINRAYQDLKDLARRSASRPPKTGFRRPSAVFVGGFLASTALVWVVFAALFYAGFFAPTSGTPVAVNSQTTDAPGPVVDPSALAAADDAAWAEAERQGTSVSLHRYLGRFSTGRHASMATDKLAIVVMSEATLSKTPDWQHRAALTEARTTLSRYLDVYPDGQLASEVRARLVAINSAEAAILADDAAWAAAQRVGTKVALLQYLEAHPKGVNQGAARETLDAIAALEARLRADDAAWTVARQAGTREALRSYLDAYPHGAKAGEARQLVAGIDTAEARRRADDVAWAVAKQAGTSEALRLYLDAHPDGGNVASALQVLASLAAAEDELSRDEADWSQAQQQNTRTALSAYLAAHPNGRHVETARARIAGLDAREARTQLPGSVKAAKQAPPGSGLGKTDAPANVRWPSADEPFVGADGRIR